jgi:DNA-binding transcriptional ArsR family regulator
MKTDKTDKMEKSAFVRVFGDTPVVRVIDFLLAERGLYDFTLTDIAENSEVSWSTLHVIFPQLIKLGLVKQTRAIARAKLYELNQENELAKKLIKTRNEISDYFIEQELKNQGHVHKHVVPVAARR